MVHEGHTRIEAAETVGVDRHSVGGWVAGVARSGEATLVSGRPGRRPDEQKALSLEQEIRIKRLISESCPDQLDLAFALWMREAVGMLIERETGGACPEFCVRDITDAKEACYAEQSQTD